MNVILISIDAARAGRVIEMLQAGQLPNMQRVLQSGGFRSEIVISPFTVNGVPKAPGDILPEDIAYFEQAVTDPGHARMLTGDYAANLGICTQAAGQQYDYHCGNNYAVVPAGRTILERIHQRGDMAVGVCCSRRADTRPLATLAALGLFTGFAGEDEIYAVGAMLDRVASHGFFSTTFANTLPSLDYFFDSSSLDVLPGEAYWNFYNDSRAYVASVELRASAVAQRAVTFMDAQTKPYFLFVHFCEPDLFGHIYGEGSTQYRQSLATCDQAIGAILDSLDASGKYSDTLLIITTDHGAELDSLPAPLEIRNGRKVFTQAGNLHGQLDADNHNLFMLNNREQLASMDQADLADYIMSSLPPVPVSSSSSAGLVLVAMGLGAVLLLGKKKT